MLMDSTFLFCSSLGEPPDQQAEQARQQLVNSTLLLLKNIVWSIECFCQKLDASLWEVTDQQSPSGRDSPVVI